MKRAVGIFSPSSPRYLLGWLASWGGGTLGFGSVDRVALFSPQGPWLDGCQDDASGRFLASSAPRHSLGKGQAGPG